jgi:predicted small lipoprotein YifL
MRQYLAFAAALIAGLLAVTLTGCGSKGPLTLPQQRPLAVPGTLLPVQPVTATPSIDANTDAKTGVNPTLTTIEKRAR